LRSKSFPTKNDTITISGCSAIVVRRARIGLGGVAATPVPALATAEGREGRPGSAETVEAAAQVLRAEGTPMSDHRASSEYRSAMLGQSLLKLHAQTTEAVSS
jgi:xanthine dehydrogenase small subunit